MLTPAREPIALFCLTWYAKNMEVRRMEKVFTNTRHCEGVNETGCYPVLSRHCETSQRLKQSHNLKTLRLLRRTNALLAMTRRRTGRGAQGGFTLAEVLITLTIIGVVAALTIPGLVASYQKKVITTKLKKFYSTMSQALALSEIDNGDIVTWQFPSYRNVDETIAFQEKYILPYFKYLRRDGTFIYLADGSIIDMSMGGCVDTHYYTSGGEYKFENFGKTQFSFTLCQHETPHFAGYLFSQYPDRASALDACKNEYFTCAALLQYDDWEFKEDYPR
jgi:prepilin-type N-terminal cleavage/methylation domain-containing protein